MSQPQATGVHGFAFEKLIGSALSHLKAAMEEDQINLEQADSWVCIVQDENQIRAFFKEVSLNGVDHMIQIETPSGDQHLFLIQEKWKLQTNQREVSQFLDCCARILARMPDYKGKIHRLWVSRTIPSLNGEKSLIEGQAILVQCVTSQNLLAVNTILTICEVLERRDLGLAVVEKIGNLLPSKEDGVLAPAEAEADTARNTFQPVSDFGEKRVLPITKQTVVRVLKEE
jgi:hypothetical protein